MIFNLTTFSHSSLETSKAMSFLNRFDTKYVIKMNNAHDFLEDIQNAYSLLQINDDVIQNYKTIYFDTPNLHCFNMHHNKRARRFKFRTRQYLSNGKIYNEIKQKLNSGKTMKFRQRRDVETNGVSVLKELSEFDDGFACLIKNNGYELEHLTPSLFVSFNRITFLNKHFPERITLDFDLKYNFGNAEAKLSDTAIVELKRDRSPYRTISQNFFRRIHKNPSSFSKYAIGISLTHEEAKKNRFLPKIRKLLCERSNRSS